jgi:hypothetical protein
MRAKQRLHVDDDHASLALIDRLMPDAYSDSCWPSKGHSELVHSQQLAVNKILSTLADGQGLLGVNGPPGTGKTTMLRDLIAAIVASRADALASLRRASDGFIKDGFETANDGGKNLHCYKLNPALYGFEIVVASSNNGAVENVTIELPQRDSIDESWLPEAEFFAELGEAITGESAWGMISGALGSKDRRAQFVGGYFYGDPHPKRGRPSGTESGEDIEYESDGETGIVDEGLSEDIGPVDEAAENSPPGEQKDRRGFQGWLNTFAEANNTRSKVEKEAIWRQAVDNYKSAKDDARKKCAEAIRIRELVQRVREIRETIADKSEALRLLKEQLEDVEAQLEHLDAEELRPAKFALGQCSESVKRHMARRPAFLAKLITLWKAQRDWNADRKIIDAEYDLASAQLTRIARLARKLEASMDGLEVQIEDAHRALRHLHDHEKELTKNATDLATTYHANHLIAWLEGNTIGRGEAIELAKPWHIEGWREARARVFIQALKLHRTFFELEPKRMGSNLRLMNRILKGSRFNGLSRDAIRSAWASLFMVTPVLSSTFSSFPRTFDTFGPGEIGWLLVDEAGQAAPQAAVGALWRSQRALLVGDPLQLKPIITVSDAVLEHMRTHYRVDAHWLPNRQSAQSLADEATQWGRMAGPVDSKRWVGMPLIVHRRCDRPMYELANRIAYDGAMVYGTPTPPRETETRASLPTGWVHAAGSSEDNWVPEEGQALNRLLDLLREDGVNLKDTSVITPFKAVRKKLEDMPDGRIKSGTIHTMQGKEAPVVILVLGGKTNGPGARDWVVSEPNLLNVAVTRAKRRLYVIGDRNDWEKRALFCDVMDLLPAAHLERTGWHNTIEP